MRPTHERPRTRRWRRRPWFTGMALAMTLGLAGCWGGGDDDADGEASPGLAGGEASDRPYCAALPDQTDSLDFGGPQFSPTPNGLVSGQALAFALTWPYYVATWPRSEQQSWIIVGVSGGMFELQTELDTRFPGARVLAMNVAWSEQQLADLAVQVQESVSQVDSSAVVDWSIASGRVSVGVTEVSDDLWEQVNRFTGLPVCVEPVLPSR
jgi:hypothetical protein